MSDISTPIIVFGAGQTAEVAAYYLEKDGGRQIAAFCVDDRYVNEAIFLGRPVVAISDLTRNFAFDAFSVFVAISFTGMNRPRAEKVRELRALGYGFTHFIHSSAVVAMTGPIKDNVMILENNVIQPGASIGENTFLWSGNHIGHHTQIGSHCYIASQSVISGAVEIGDYCFVGVNATIRDNVKIGAKSIIGAGTLILEDTLEEQVFKARGTPGRRVPSSRVKI